MTAKNVQLTSFLLEGILCAFELSMPSLRLLPILYGTLRERALREEARIRRAMTRCVRRFRNRFCRHRHVSPWQRCSMFSWTKHWDDPSDENIRFAVMEKLVLPLFFRCHTFDGALR